MKSNSLLQIVKDKLIKKPCKKKRTMKDNAVKAFTHKPVLEKTGLQQIAEQHRNLVEQHKQSFLSAKPESASAPEDNDSKSTSHSESELQEHRKETI